MLHLMIDHHPEICNFGEFEFAVSFAEGNSFPSVDEYRIRLREDRQFTDTGLTLSELDTYEGIVRDFLRQKAIGSGKRFISANVHGRFDLLRRIWPDARFILLLRDPRDVARSCIGMGWVGNVWNGADYWTSVMERWNQMRDRVSEKDVCIVRYESLVRSPEDSLSKICEFFGTKFDEQMLRFHETSSYSKVDAQLAEQWRTKLSRREIELVESKCRPLMEQYGYEPAGKLAHPSAIEKTYLNLQSLTFRWRFNLHRYGIPLYLQWQLAKRFTSSSSSFRKRAFCAVNQIDRNHLK